MKNTGLVLRQDHSPVPKPTANLPDLELNQPMLPYHDGWNGGRAMIELFYVAGVAGVIYCLAKEQHQLGAILFAFLLGAVTMQGFFGG
jgi:hypothetical protein